MTTTRDETTMSELNMTIAYGETQEDTQYVDDVLQTILRACKQAKDEVDDVAAGRADLTASLTGCLTMLGFVAPVGAAPVDHLRAVLLATARAESDASEAILNAVRRVAGRIPSEACSRAAVHTARRGTLHVCAEEIDAALAHLTEVEAWYAARAARR